MMTLTALIATSEPERLLCSKQHNKYYRKIYIHYNALNDLPEDGNLPDLSGIKYSSITKKESSLQDSDEDAHET